MKVFFQEGRINATTQEIADTAGVNRTLIHYYFKSRDSLFNKVNDVADKIYRDCFDQVYLLEIPFRQKVRLLIESIIKLHEEFPFLELYLSTGVVQIALDNNLSIPVPEDKIFAFNHFYKEVEHELSKGNLKASSPMHFLTNILSLSVYPFLMRPLQLRIYKISEEKYKDFLEERTDEIMGLLFR